MCRLKPSFFFLFLSYFSFIAYFWELLFDVLFSSRSNPNRDVIFLFLIVLFEFHFFRLLFYSEERSTRFGFEHIAQILQYDFATTSFLAFLSCFLAFYLLNIDNWILIEVVIITIWFFFERSLNALVQPSQPWKKDLIRYFTLQFFADSMGWKRGSLDRGRERGNPIWLNISDKSHYRSTQDSSSSPGISRTLFATPSGTPRFIYWKNNWIPITNSRSISING